MLAIALLALFGLAFVSPLLALSSGSESNVPMCCRKGGQHHCMAGMQGAGQNDAPGLRAPVQRCPSYPAAVTAQVHGVGFAPGTAAAVYAGVVAHPAGTAQTECRLRMAKVRARGLRGPPVVVG